MNNKTRAKRMDALVRTYALSHDDGEDTSTVVTDMIADLLHYLNDRDAYPVVLEQARHHYEIEAEIWRTA